MPERRGSSHHGCLPGSIGRFESNPRAGFIKVLENLLLPGVKLKPEYLFRESIKMDYTFIKVVFLLSHYT